MSSPHRFNPYEHGLDSTYRRILTNLKHEELVTVALELLALLFEVNTALADNPWTVAGRTPVERIVAQRESARAVAFAKVRANNITKKKDIAQAEAMASARAAVQAGRGLSKALEQLAAQAKPKEMTATLKPDSASVS